MAAEIISQKTCSKCGIVKPLPEFWKHRGHKNGINAACKPCARPPVSIPLSVRRLWRNTVKTETCWLWNGATQPFGHGILRVNKRIVFTHRLSYSITYGEIPQGLCVLHKCDVPNCVRPDHLFLGTRADNNRDMTKKGRNVSRGAPRGDTNGSAILTSQQVLEIKARYDAKRGSQSKLAREYGVRRHTINDIVHNKTWSHL